MKHNMELIDYLRGLSILAITIIHVIAWKNPTISSEYAQWSILFELRDVLQLFVVTIVISSGFSLYLAHKELSLSPKDLLYFYKKRFRRLLVPWWTFLTIFFSIHYIIKLIFGLELIELSRDYMWFSFLMVGGIGFGWLVLLMLTLALLFPFLHYLYTHFDKKTVFGGLIIAYGLALALFEFEHIHFFELNLATVSLETAIVIAIPFILGWSIIYLVGFWLGEIYTSSEFMKKGLWMTVGFSGVFVFINAIYTILGFDKHLYLNKYPPAPEYLSFGLMVSFLLIMLFLSYKHFMHVYFRKFLHFFSSNSYWLFMWCALTLSLFDPWLSLFEFKHLTLKLIIAIVLNTLGISLLVLAQNKLIKIVHFNLKKERR